MVILKLSKRALSIISLTILGFLITCAWSVMSEKVMAISIVHSPLSQTPNQQQVGQNLVPYSTREVLWEEASPLNLAAPTPEMVVFFERRTREHIDLVHRNLAALAELPEYSEEIVDRGEIHDASKFIPPERLPYIWLTEFHRRRQNDEVFTYPEGVEEQVQAAVRHHVTSNRHHPEFHVSPDEMSDTDIIEMVCDWTAIAQELGGMEGSARPWADRTIGNREHFNFGEVKKQFIYRVIDDLDRQLAVSS